MSSSPRDRSAALTRAPVAPARRCAYVVLRRVFEDGAYSDRALQGEAKDLDTRDRALAMRLLYGTVQRKGTLDHLIARLAARPPEQLDARLLAALRLGLYELLYLSGAPDHAVVGDAVELAKGGARGAHGLVNAVLRRGAREGRALVAELGEETPEEAAIKHSHPEWIAALWWKELGSSDARALMAYDNEAGEVALRVNTLLTDATTVAEELGVPTHRDPELSEALVLEGPFDAHGSRAWRAGAILAQSRAAMHVSHSLDPQPGERVLDLCAAPGGKSTHMAALMAGEGEVVAVERNARRAGVLSRTAQRLQVPNIRVEVADATKERAEGAVFDRVLVDPPCSGLGTLQARADLRWRVTPEQVGEMARTQAAILSAGAAALRPGGVLVYSTCTISPTENELQIAAFLDTHPDFSCDDLAAELPGARMRSPAAPSGRGEGAPAELRSAAGTAGFVLTLPHRDHTAGFFIARLRRG